MEGEIDLTVGGFRPDGQYVVRKMCPLWCPDRHTREVNAYQLLSDQGPLNQHFCFTLLKAHFLLKHRQQHRAADVGPLERYSMVIEFEYQPSTREYPDTMARLREYMGSALKVHFVISLLSLALS